MLIASIMSKVDHRNKTIRK